MRIEKPDAISYMSPLHRVQTSFEGINSLTHQDAAEHVNINNIYRKTQLGQLPIGSSKMPDYGDFSNVESYDTALDVIRRAEEAFMDLPADIRKKYNNDPQEYYEKTLSDAQQHVEIQQAKAMEEKEAKDAEKALQDARALVMAHPED